jgi:hypothetical protein
MHFSWILYSAQKLPWIQSTVSKRNGISNDRDSENRDWTLFCYYMYFNNLLFLCVCLDIICVTFIFNQPIVSFVMSVCPSVRPYGTTRLPLDGLLWYLICEDFPKICPDNSRYTKIGYFTWRPIYIFDHISFSSSLNEKRFKHFVEKIKTHILYPITFLKIVPLMRKCQVTDDTAHVHFMRRT